MTEAGDLSFPTLSSTHIQLSPQGSDESFVVLSRGSSPEDGGNRPLDVTGVPPMSFMSLTSDLGMDQLQDMIGKLYEENTQLKEVIMESNEVSRRQYEFMQEWRVKQGEDREEANRRMRRAREVVATLKGEKAELVERTKSLEAEVEALRTAGQENDSEALRGEQQLRAQAEDKVTELRGQVAALMRTCQEKEEELAGMLERAPLPTSATFSQDSSSSSLPKVSSSDSEREVSTGAPPANLTLKLSLANSRVEELQRQLNEALEKRAEADAKWTEMEQQMHQQADMMKGMEEEKANQQTVICQLQQEVERLNKEKDEPFELVSATPIPAPRDHERQSQGGQEAQQQPASGSVSAASPESPIPTVISPPSSGPASRVCSMEEHGHLSLQLRQMAGVAGEKGRDAEVLTLKCHDLKQQLEACKKTLDEERQKMTLEIATLRARVIDQEDQMGNAPVQQAIQQSMEALEPLQRTTGELQDMVGRQEEQLETRGQQLETALAELERYKERCKAQQAELRQREAAVSAATATPTPTDQNAGEEKEELETTRAMLDSALLEVEKHKEEIKLLQTRVIEEQEKRTQAERGRGAMVERQQQQQAEGGQSTREEGGSLEARMRQCEKDKEQAEAKLKAIKQLRTEREMDLRKEVEELQGHMTLQGSAYTAELTTKTAELKTAREHLVKAVPEIKRLKQEVEKLTGELDTSQDRFRKAVEEYEKLLDQYEQCKDSKAEVDILKERLMVVEMELRDESTKVAQQTELREAEAAELKLQIRELRDEKEVCKLQVDTYRADFALEREQRERAQGKLDEEAPARAELQRQLTDLQRRVDQEREMENMRQLQARHAAARSGGSSGGGQHQQQHHQQQGGYDVHEIGDWGFVQSGEAGGRGRGAMTNQPPARAPAAPPQAAPAVNCPVCNKAFPDEDKVRTHIDACLAQQDKINSPRK